MATRVYEDGPVCFRQKIIMSILLYQPIKIINIRNRRTNPGVTETEISFLKLINELSNGAVIRINDTGCTVSFSPGTLIGGEASLNLPSDRGLGYILEPLLILSPFTKMPMVLSLNGVTNNNIDPSVDVIVQTWLPLLKKFLPPASSSALKIEIKKRGVAPKGGGHVRLFSRPCRVISPIQFTSPGKIYRIRGVAWTCRVSPGIAPQLVHGAKELLNSFLSDVYINLDQRKRDAVGESAGYGLVLWAETKEGAYFSSEVTSASEGEKTVDPDVPSELGYKAASRLLDQISLGGCADQSLQAFAMTLMALEGGHNASQLLVSAPTQYNIANLRLIRQNLGVTFDFSYETIEDGDTHSTADDNISSSPSPPLVTTCFGCGLKNINLSIR